MSVVDPIFGRTAVNAASSCGCTCTQTTPTIEYNLSINYDGAHNAVS